jgi:hypothetical protein
MENAKAELKMTVYTPTTKPKSKAVEQDDSNDEVSPQYNTTKESADAMSGQVTSPNFAKNAQALTDD